MLRVSARWLVHADIPTTCARCDSALIPHLPACVSCGAAAPQSLQELDLPESALDKPPGAIRIAHLSDIHIGFPTAPRPSPIAIFRIWLERFSEAQVDLLIVSGDLIERPGDKYGLLLAHAMLEDFPGEWVVCPGNHDIKRPGTPDVFFDIFGTFPRVEHHFGIDFILLDSMVGLPMAERDVAERMYGDYVCYTEGRVGRAQYDAVSALLESSPTSERHLVLHHHIMRQHADLMPHVPKQAKVTEDLFGTMKSLLDSDQLLSWAGAHGVDFIYHGHKHVFMEPGVRPGQLVILNAGSSTLHEGSLQRARFVDVLDGQTGRQISNLELLL